MPEVTFKQKAHTISESLGNKTIITNTECDECNNQFGSGIEKDFANYHQFIRAFYNVQGKAGKAGLGQSNYTVTHQADNSIKIGITLSKDEIAELERHEKSEKNQIMFPLKPGISIMPQNIYKALCKYAIGILPDDILEPLSNTIKWMRGEYMFRVLPNVAYCFPTGFRLKNPRITTFIRHNENGSLPFAIGVVEFTDVAYAFVIPVDSDTVDYSCPDLWQNIYENFPLFDTSKGWVLKDFSDTAQITPNVNLSLTRRS